MTRIVSKIDEEISIDPKYIQKVLQAERGPGRWSAGEGEEEMGLGMAIDKPDFQGLGFKG